MNVEELADALGNLGVVDAIALVKMLEKRWGVSSTRRIGNFVKSIVEETAEEEQQEFNVILQDCGLRKIEIIKIARQLHPEMGLKEAKDFVETPNVCFSEGVSYDMAKQLVERLEEAGANVKIV